MTCGIYVLKFNGTNSVYVGQSVNIEVRYRVHKQKLRDQTHNYKMLDAYDRYGLPILEILCECEKAELNDLEKEAFGIYNSIDDGFNIAEEPDTHQEGEKNGASKYTNEQIYLVLEYLTDENNRYKDIALATGVSESTVRHVAAGESHTWLSREYPELYNKMKNITGSVRKSLAGNAKSRKVIYPSVISPSGEIFSNIENANAFARKYNMDSSYFIKMLNGKALSCKGWRVYNE